MAVIPNISLRLRAGTFSRREPGQNEISLRRKSPSLARCKAADEMEFSFSKRLLLSHPFFVPSPFLSSPLFAQSSERAHTWRTILTRTRGLPPLQWLLCPSDHRVCSARGTIKRSRTKRYDGSGNTTRGEAGEGNYQAHRRFVFVETTDFPGGRGSCFH